MLEMYKVNIIKYLFMVKIFIKYLKHITSFAKIIEIVKHFEAYYNHLVAFLVNYYIYNNKFDSTVEKYHFESKNVQYLQYIITKFCKLTKLNSNEISFKYFVMLLNVFVLFFSNITNFNNIFLYFLNLTSVSLFLVCTSHNQYLLHLCKCWIDSVYAKKNIIQGIPFIISNVNIIDKIIQYFYKLIEHINFNGMYKKVLIKDSLSESSDHVTCKDLEKRKNILQQVSMSIDNSLKVENILRHQYMTREEAKLHFKIYHDFFLTDGDLTKYMFIANFYYVEWEPTTIIFLFVNIKIILFFFCLNIVTV